MENSKLSIQIFESISSPVILFIFGEGERKLKQKKKSTSKSGYNLSHSFRVWLFEDMENVWILRKY